VQIEENRRCGPTVQGTDVKRRVRGFSRVLNPLVQESSRSDQPLLRTSTKID